MLKIFIKISYKISKFSFVSKDGFFIIRNKSKIEIKHSYKILLSVENSISGFENCNKKFVKLM